jgi:hypothetical protein
MVPISRPAPSLYSLRPLPTDPPLRPLEFPFKITSSMFHTIIVTGERVHLRGNVWSGPPPVCGHCDTSLGAGGDADARTAVICAAWPGEQYVECSGCGWLYPMDGARPLPRNLAHLDGWLPPVDFGEHS